MSDKPEETHNEEATVTLKESEYERMCAALEARIEDALDILMFDEAMLRGDAQSLPSDVVFRVLAGELHPLKAWRNEAGLTIKELANASSVRAATISDIENGKIDPRFGTLKKLAKTLRLDVSDIMN